MKRKTIFTPKFSQLKRAGLLKNILSIEKQSKIKGGLNPWVEGPG